jgi:hypothetical protein
MKSHIVMLLLLVVPVAILTVYDRYRTWHSAVINDLGSGIYTLTPFNSRGDELGRFIVRTAQGTVFEVIPGGGFQELKGRRARQCEAMIEQHLASAMSAVKLIC